MRRNFLTLMLTLIVGSVQAGKSITTESNRNDSKSFHSGTLLFEDNFGTLDMSIWQHENTMAGTGNSEFQWYTNNRSNSYIKDGILHIKPTFVSDEFGEDFLSSGTVDINGGTPYEACTNPSFSGCYRTGSDGNIINPIKSASIYTLESFSFLYGKVEVRAQVPSGDWLSPAICLLPKYNFYGTWPASGRIDLMQSWGNKKYQNVLGQTLDSRKIAQTLHWGPNKNYNRHYLTHYEEYDAQGFDMNYHNYQLEWTPEHIKFSLDDEEIAIVTPGDDGFWQIGSLTNSGTQNPWLGGSKMAPFDQEFYISLKLAVGGATAFPDNPAISKKDNKPWENGSPDATTNFWNARQEWEPSWNRDTDRSHLKVDYIRVWTL